METGVSAVAYNAEKGLMTVTGDVEPMTIVRKLSRWGKKAELVSVNYQLDDLISDDEEEEDSGTSSDTSSSPDSKTMEREAQEKTKTKTNKKKKGMLRKPFLLGCLSSKPKVDQPFAMRNRNWHIPSKFENGPPGYGFPFANPSTSQWRPTHPMMPYPLMMMQQQPQAPMMPYLPMMQQQQPQVPMTGGAPMPYNVNMFRPAPPPTQQSQPYFKSIQAQTGNPKLHYPDK